MNTKQILSLMLVLSMFLSCSLKAQEQTAENAAALTENAADNEEAAEEQEMIVNADSADVQLDEDNHPVAIELEGNVSIEDVTMRFTAKKMTVHLDKNNKPINIEAVGGVTVRKLDGSGSASGETGRYDAELDTVVLKGNCVILQEKNTIRGEQVVYDRKTGKIKLKGASLTLPMKKGQGGMGFGDLLKGATKEKEKEADRTETKEKTEKKDEGKKADNQKDDGTKDEKPAKQAE